MPLITSISGIRGTVGGSPFDSLSPQAIVSFASAYGQWLKQAHPKVKKPKVVIGRDARSTGSWVFQLTSSTLQSMGISVINLGLSTTPTVEMAVVAEKAQGGIILTASHNPAQWNALKLLNEQGEFLSKAAGAEILKLKDSDNIQFTKPSKFGTLKKKKKYLDYHINKILNLELVDAHAIADAEFKIAIDGINSSGAVAVPQLLDALGVKGYTLINEEPNGLFAHNPEPLEENLHGISDLISDGNFDLGIVVDPDVDRLAFMEENGSMFGEEYTLVAVADYLLQHKKGPVVSNLSSSRALKDLAEQAGCEYHPSAVGEVNVVEKMKAVDAVIGGEGNGGIIYPELHYGRDALVGIALMLTYLAKSGKRMSELRKSYPDYHMAKEKIELTPEIDVDKVLVEIATKYQNNEVNKVDGVKVDFEDQWVHLRKSNTEPIIRVYTEAGAKHTAQALAKKIMEDIREVIKTM